MGFPVVAKRGVESELRQANKGLEQSCTSVDTLTQGLGNVQEVPWAPRHAAQTHVGQPLRMPPSPTRNLVRMHPRRDPPIWTAEALRDTVGYPAGGVGVDVLRPPRDAQRGAWSHPRP